MIGLRECQAPDCFLPRRTEATVHGVYIRQNQEHLGLDFASENRCYAVFVGHGIDALESQLRIAIHRGPAASARDHDMAGPRQVAHHLPFNDPNRLWARCEPASVFHGNSPADEARLAHGIEHVADGLRWRPQIGIVGVAQRLGDQGDDRTLHAGAGQRVLERLLDHVAHPAGRSRDEHAER